MPGWPRSFAFAVGSALDPPTRHGRAALLATLMADGCGVAQGAALDSRLLALDATIGPLVDAQHVGLLISAPVDKTAGAVDLALRCALRPALTSRALEDARLKLLRSLWGPSGRATPGGARSPALADRSGLGSPLGRAIRDRRGADSGATTAAREPLSGVRTEVLVVADRAPEDLAQFVARRVAQIPPGRVSSARGRTRKLTPGRAHRSGALRAVIGLRVDSLSASEIAPQLAADRLARELSPHVGGALWSSGGITGQQAWAGVAVSLSEQELAVLDQRVSSALRRLAAAPAETLRAPIHRAIAMEQSVRLSSARGYALGFFSGTAEQEPSVNGELDLLKQFATATPAFFVLRPAP